MRAITIRQPWAELIIRGDKDVENRSWRTTHRGPLLIHAGLAADRASCEQYRVPEDVEHGAIIGVVELVDVTRTRTSPWHEDGSWGWYLARARRFRKPIPLKGKRMLFDVPDRKVAAALDGWLRDGRPARRRPVRSRPKGPARPRAAPRRGAARGPQAGDEASSAGRTRASAVSS